MRQVIYFLDNRAHELERNVADAKKKCEHLEASLDLVRNANSYKVKMVMECSSVFIYNEIGTSTGC